MRLGWIDTSIARANAEQERRAGLAQATVRSGEHVPALTPPTTAPAIPPKLPAWELIEQAPTRVGGRTGTEYVYRCESWIEKNPRQQAAGQQAAVEWDPKDYDILYGYLELVRVPASRDAGLTGDSYEWSNRASYHHVETALLGWDAEGEAWLGRGPIGTLYTVSRQLSLQGGDDMLALLAKGMGVEDPGHSTANSCIGILARQGDDAVPYLESALKTRNPQLVWSGAIVLGAIQSDRATELLLQLYAGEETRDAGAYGLVRPPYREKAHDVYLDLLKRGKYMSQAEAACVQFGWKDALPVLSGVMASTTDFAQYLGAFYTVRALEGKPVPDELRDMKINVARGQQDVAEAKRMLLASTDSEAARVAALELAIGWYGKMESASEERARRLGREVLVQLPHAPTLALAERFRQPLSVVPVNALLDSLRANPAPTGTEASQEESP